MTLVAPEKVAEQRTAYEALLSRLGMEATDVEVEQFLAEREVVEPEPGLEPEAVIQLKERIAEGKGSANKGH